MLSVLTLLPLALVAPAPAWRGASLLARCASPIASELRVERYEPTASAAAKTVEDRLQQLRALWDLHGHALPTAESCNDASLVRWAARQRKLHRQNSLSASLVDELNAVGFVWDPLSHAWDARYEELESFFADNGHSDVPSTQGALGRWVSRQRRLHRQGTLRGERRDALLELSFEFDPLAARWERQLAECAAALLRNPRGPLPEPLAGWAKRQRAAHAAGRLAPERVEALNQLVGWSWATPRARGPAALRRLGQRMARECGAGEAGEQVVSQRTGSSRSQACYVPCASAGRACVAKRDVTPPPRAPSPSRPSGCGGRTGP